MNVAPVKAGRTGMSDEEKLARGARIRSLRSARKLTQDQLADEAGVERTRIVTIEAGKNAVTSGELQRSLARAFGVTVASFVAYLDGELAEHQLEPETVEPTAQSFLADIKRLPGFSKWLQSPEAESLSLSDVTKVVRAYDTMHPTSRPGDLAPAKGWGPYCRDVLSGRINQPRKGSADALDAAEVEALPAAARKRLRSAGKNS